MDKAPNINPKNALEVKLNGLIGLKNVNTLVINGVKLKILLGDISLEELNRLVAHLEASGDIRGKTPVEITAKILEGLPPRFMPKAESSVAASPPSPPREFQAAAAAPRQPSPPPSPPKLSQPAAAATDSMVKNIKQESERERVSNEEIFQLKKMSEEREQAYRDEIFAITKLIRSIVGNNAFWQKIYQGGIEDLPKGIKALQEINNSTITKQSTTNTWEPEKGAVPNPALFKENLALLQNFCDAAPVQLSKGYFARKEPEADKFCEILISMEKMLSDKPQRTAKENIEQRNSQLRDLSKVRSQLEQFAPAVAAKAESKPK